MGFEIKFPNGDIVPIAQLDKEAAELWNTTRPIDPEHHVFPVPPEGTDIGYDENVSWFEMIGLAIEFPEVVGAIPMYPTWMHVKETMFNGQMNSGSIWSMESGEIVHEVSRTILFLKPYMDLIDYWIKQNYIPVKTQ